MVKPLYSPDPHDSEAFQKEFDGFYTRFAPLYDFLIKVMPFWKWWLSRTLEHVKGKRLLEVSFGTGYLLTRYPKGLEIHGIDYNAKMVEVAGRNIKKKGMSADLRQGNVENLPYEDNTFDTIINTMAMSGYPDAVRALSEIKRVLKPGGTFVLVDITYPKNRNWAGTRLTRFWQAMGDIIRDMDSLLEGGFDYNDIEIGGFGSVHMYVCKKKLE